jgi:hypothetical protein
MLVYTSNGHNRFILTVCDDKKSVKEIFIPDGTDINFKIEKIDSIKLSKGEKEFNRIVKNLTSIYDKNHDPFLFYVLTNEKMSIRFNKKSTSLLFRDGYYRDLSVKAVQSKRKTISVDYPHIITLTLSSRDRHSISSYITTRHYLINRLCSITNGTGMFDICFKTEKSLNKFIKEYAIGKVHSIEPYYETKELKLKNSTKIRLYGKHLANVLSKWKNVHTLNNFQSCPPLDVILIRGEKEYERKLKEVHVWASKNLQKKFLMMGTYPEIWLFEDEDDMNFFMMRWS